MLARYASRPARSRIGSKKGRFLGTFRLSVVAVLFFWSAVPRVATGAQSNQNVATGAQSDQGVATGAQSNQGLAAEKPSGRAACSTAPSAATPPVTEDEARALIDTLFADPCEAAVAEVRPPGPDIFNSVALPVTATALDARWRRLGGASATVSGGAWAAVSARAAGQHGLEQLQTINSWVNRHIAYAVDNRGDHWADLSETIARGRGDCEDFAIAKMRLLERAGVPADTLYLVIVTDTISKLDHAVLVAHEDGAFLVLDSRTDRILRSGEVTDYRPVLSFASRFAWTHGYRSAAGQVASAEAAKVTPAARAGSVTGLSRR